DPLLFADLLLFFESLKMAPQYNVHLNREMIVILFVIIIGTIFFFFFVSMKITSLKARMISLLCLLFLGTVILKNVYLNEKLYTSIQNYELVNKWSQTDQFVSRGFIYPFIYSASSAVQKAPEGYNEKSAKEMLSEYEYSHIDEEKKVHIIAIMLEAYNDFSKFAEIEFVEDVYQVWHELERESYSGKLVSNVFAGNTINTERSFLTGYTYL